MMEMFSLPLGEIRDRFTKSEVVMLGWRSQEQHWHFKKKMDKSKRQERKGSYDGDEDMGTGSKQRDPDIPEGLPDKYFNAEGDLDLSGVTGLEARQYLEHIGMPFPETGIARTLPVGDAVSEAYRKKPRG